MILREPRGWDAEAAAEEVGEVAEAVEAGGKTGVGDAGALAQPVGGVAQADVEQVAVRGCAGEFAEDAGEVERTDPHRAGKGGQ